MGKVSTIEHGEEAVGAAETGVDDDDGKAKYLEEMPPGLGTDEEDDNNDDDDDEEEEEENEEVEDDKRVDDDADCAVRGTGVCIGVMSCRRGVAEWAPGTEEKNFSNECDLISGRVTVGREGGALMGRVGAVTSSAGAAATTAS